MLIFETKVLEATISHGFLSKEGRRTNLEGTC